MYFWGLDISLNSNSITIIDDIGNIEIYVFTFENSLLKKHKFNWFNNFNIEYEIIDKTNISSKEISELKNSIELKSKLKLFLENLFNENKELKNSICVMEGFSFNSLGNNSRYIGTHYLLRELFYNYFKNNFHIVAPTTIKKFIGNGKMNKQNILEKFLIDDRVPNTLIHNVKTYLEQFGNKKPLDDIIDSFYISLYAKNVIYGNF